MRAVASLPWNVTTSSGNKPCQTTDLDELAEIIVDAAEGKHGQEADYAIASKQVMTLEEVQNRFRTWLGLSKGWQISIPDFALSLVSRCADAAGYFGWRSPLRTTAVKILEEGVVADNTLNLIQTSPLSETLGKHPSGTQDIWFGRAYFLKPAIILILAAFWLISGLIALFNIDAATAYFSPLGLGAFFNLLLLIGTSLLDCLLGIAILFRKYVKWAALGMIALSLSYLASATLIVPALWFDPVGPLVKVIPSIFLTITLLATLEER